MRKIIPFLLLSILFFGCKKVERKAEDYYPEVKIIDAQLQPDGTVQVTGEVVSHGTEDIIFAGFCMDTVADFTMMTNQQQVDEISGNRFTTIYSNLNKAHEYYFRAWVANPYGYNVSEEYVSVDSVTISAEFVPCTLPLDSLVITSSQSVNKLRYYSIGDIDDSWQLELYCYSPGVQMIIRFSKKPVSGVYKTSQSGSVGSSTVYILMNGYEVKNGANVYVREITTEEIEVSICEATTGDNKNISTSFRARYE